MMMQDLQLLWLIHYEEEHKVISKNKVLLASRIKAQEVSLSAVHVLSHVALACAAHATRACGACRSSHASLLPNGEQVPDILVERCHGGEQCWRKMLAQVDDDLESRYLAAKRDQLEFVLSVPNHGKPIVERLRLLSR